MARVPLPPGYDVRPFVASDEGALGPLMADAYRGGVEDHGESLDYHREEAHKTLIGGFGAVLWHASWWATRAGVPVGVTIVTDWAEHHETGLSFALVHPAARGNGLGAALITKSGHALAAAGHRDWVLAVVPENPALRLYERLGFRAFDPHGTS
jgi:ribosomal protein S18 acetylase RimI-like enzyme